MKIDICSKDGFFSFSMSQSEKQSESISSQPETEKESSNKAPGEYRYTIYMHGPISYMEYPQLTSKDISYLQAAQYRIFLAQLGANARTAGDKQDS